MLQSAVTIISFYGGSFVMLHGLRIVRRFLNPPLQIVHKALTVMDVHERVRRIECLVQRDEGKRGIAEITLPQGELLEMAQKLSSHDIERVGIITGFPCMLDHEPPTETDGPMGAMAIARCLLTLGKTVVLATDECNEEVLLACSAASGLMSQYREKFQLESFPPLSRFDKEDEERLSSIRCELDAVIAIERAGPNKDGKYLTMRGRDMSHLIAPLEDLLVPPESGRSKPLLTIGIGDGGNEVGMGKIFDHMQTSVKSITNAREIACIVPAQYLLVASVSNWGGYALAGATALMHTTTTTTAAAAGTVGVEDCLSINGSTASSDRSGSNSSDSSNSSKSSSMCSAKDNSLPLISNEKVTKDLTTAGLDSVEANTNAINKSVSILPLPLPVCVSLSESVPVAVLEEALAKALPTEEVETEMCRRMVFDAGARDGISGKCDLFVDGMPLSESLLLLRKIRSICSSGGIL